MNATIEQIRAEEEASRIRFEAETVVTEEGETIAELRKVFDAVCDPTDWKAAWAAYVPHQIVGKVMRAVEYYHADRPVVCGMQPITGKVLLEGKGYQA